MSIRVRATQPGYYDHVMRKVGEVFVLSDKKLFSHRWMESVDGEVDEEVPAKKAAPKKKKESVTVAAPSGDEDVI